MRFFLRKQVDTHEASISSIAKQNNTNAHKLTRAYKENFSGFNDYVKAHQESFHNQTFVFPENFGTNMAIDETGLFQGDLYTIIYNKDNRGKKGSLAAIIKGTKANIITDAISKQVDMVKRINIEEITLDLSNSMDWITREIAPNAIKTFDRFHVEKLITEAVQQIRIKYRWEAIERENKLKNDENVFRLPRYSNGDSPKQLLARSRYLLFKRKSQWTSQQKQRAKLLFQEYPLLAKAYRYYMEFKEVYKMNKLSAKDYLLNWIRRVKTSKIAPLVTVAKTIESHLGGIINYLENRSTNASIENFNRKLKSLLERVRGVRNKDLFFYRIINLYA